MSALFLCMFFRMYGLSSWFSASIIISAYIIVYAADFKIPAFPENDGYYIRSHVTGTRWSRSIPGVGGAVVKALLKGTKEVALGNSVNRKFYKQGSESDAISDFDSLNCKIVRNKNYGSIGYKGHTKFTLTLNYFHPTIKISDPSMDRPIKIVYNNMPVE